MWSHYHYVRRSPKSACHGPWWHGISTTGQSSVLNPRAGKTRRVDTGFSSCRVDTDGGGPSCRHRVGGSGEVSTPMGGGLSQRATYRWGKT
eukprot:gene10876-biopygen9369